MANPDFRGISCEELRAQSGPGPLGRCIWIDRVSGEQRCCDLTEFACEQQGGDWNPAERCSPEH